jgi:hypothetical protein
VPYTIKYQTDSKDGPEFQKISQAQGWVEYLNNLGQVYYFPQLDRHYYESRRQNLVNRMPAYIVNQGGVDYLGWIYHLAQQRLLDKFVLPIFGSVDTVSGTTIQCGNSRIDASIMCGIGPEHIPVIAFCASRMHISAPAERLQSTQQFNNIFKLDNIDYRIVFEESDSSRISFINSVLRHTIYESSPETTTHYSVNTFDCMSFWRKFQTEDNQFEIQIHCTQQTRSHIVPSNLFKIEYIDKNFNEWEFSYGRMLGAFNNQTRKTNTKSKLQLWLYDITEPVNLELLIPWMKSHHNFYKTQNEKAVIIHGESKSNGLQVIGNWVQ